MNIQEQLEELQQFDSQGLPVTSLYLDVDGRRWGRKECAIRLKNLIQEEQVRLAEQELDRPARESVGQDWDRLQQWVHDRFDRRGAKGLVVFSCAARQWWQEYRLPEPVRSRLVVDRRPYTRPLKAILDEHHRYGVVLVDRSRARLFQLYLGEIEERSEVFSEVPQLVSGSGQRFARDERQIERHVEEHVRRHLKHVAEVAFDLYQRGRFWHLILGGPKELLAQLERTLHHSLQRIIVGRIPLDPGASVKEVQEASLAVDQAYVQQEQAQLAQRIKEEAAAGRLGVVGLAPTLEALNMGAVHTLAVTREYVAPGVQCSACGFLGTEETECPRCGGRAVETREDVVAEALNEAAEQGCSIARLATPEELQPVGHVGALLRFRWD